MSKAKRLLGLMLGVYLGAALTSRVLERMGVYQCGCYDTCWCKKPGLSVFRWVFPRFHRGPWADEKRAFEA